MMTSTWNSKFHYVQVPFKPESKCLQKVLNGKHKTKKLRNGKDFLISIYFARLWPYSKLMSLESYCLSSPDVFPQF